MREFTFLYNYRPISSGSHPFSQGAKVKMKKSFFFSSVKLNVFWNIEFFSLTGKYTFAKVKYLWKFQNFMSFFYLVSVLVTFARLKILQKWDLKRVLPSAQATGSFEILEKKGIIQDTKQHKVTRQVCNPVNRVRHFQTAVYWSLLVLRSLLNALQIQITMYFSYLISRVFSITCSMIRPHNLHKK